MQKRRSGAVIATAPHNDKGMQVRDEDGPCASQRRRGRGRRTMSRPRPPGYIPRYGSGQRESICERCKKPFHGRPGRRFCTRDCSDRGTIRRKTDVSSLVLVHGVELDAKDLAKMVGAHPDTIRRCIRRGRNPLTVRPASTDVLAKTRACDIAICAGCGGRRSKYGKSLCLACYRSAPRSKRTE